MVRMGMLEVLNTVFLLTSSEFRTSGEIDPKSLQENKDNLSLLGSEAWVAAGGMTPWLTLAQS